MWPYIFPWNKVVFYLFLKDVVLYISLEQNGYLHPFLTKKKVALYLSLE